MSELQEQAVLAAAMSVRIAAEELTAATSAEEQAEKDYSSARIRVQEARERMAQAHVALVDAIRS